MDAAVLVQRDYVVLENVRPAHQADTASAAPTIQAAINAAEDNDPVYVKVGIYLITNGAIVMRTVRLLGGFEGEGNPGPRNPEPAANCILDARGSNRVFWCEGCMTDSVIDGFTITGGRPNSSEPDWWRGGGLYFLVDYSTLRNCHIVSNRLPWIQHLGGGGMFLESRCATRILGNFIAYNDAGYSGGFYAVGGGIANQAAGVLIANNFVHANKVGSPYSAPNQGGGGIYSQGGLVVNNTICCNTSYISAAVAGIILYNAAAFNNIIVSNAPTGMYQYNSSGDYNCVWGNLPSNYSNCTVSAHDVTANPLFLNRQPLDYHLSTFSPCINAGTPVPVFDDIDGHRRPHRGAWDIGCDEAFYDQGAVVTIW